jgi:lactate permease
VLPAMWSVAFVGASGTAILISAVITALSSREITLAAAGRELGTAASELWRPLTMIAAVMAVAFVANFSGGSSSIGLGLAGTGRIFPLVSPVIGWFGVFVTGSVVNGNTLFAHLQAVTATQVGVDQALLVAANTSGGVMAKLISPQSIAVAAAAVGLVGSEAAIMRTTLQYSVGLLAYVCVWTLALSYGW